MNQKSSGMFQKISALILCVFVSCNSACMDFFPSSTSQGWQEAMAFLQDATKPKPSSAGYDGCADAMSFLSGMQNHTTNQDALDFLRDMSQDDFGVREEGANLFTANTIFRDTSVISALKQDPDLKIAFDVMQDSAQLSIYALKAALQEEDSISDDVLLSRGVYNAVSAHDAGLSSVLAFINDGGNLKEAFAAGVEEAESSGGSSGSSSSTDELLSFLDESHIENIKSKDQGISFESIASSLTLWSYCMQRLANDNPDEYRALLMAWEARVKAVMAVGAISALEGAIPSGGVSIIGFGASLGMGLGLDYIADLISQYGSEKAAVLASGSDAKLYGSYQKTFDFVGAMVARHGIRAGLTKVGKQTLHPMVKPIGRQMPINAAYAGKTMSIHEIGEKLKAYHKDKDFRNPYQHDISFTARGFPDFSRYSIRRVKITMTGDRNIDSRQADKAAGFSGAHKKPEGYTWHHNPDCQTMELIPADLHKAVKHTGGAAIIKDAIREALEGNL